jgi:hypothetical protein
LGLVGLIVLLVVILFLVQLRLLVVVREPALEEVCKMVALVVALTIQAPRVLERLGKGIMAVQEMLAKLLVVEEVLALLVEMLQQALEVLVALGLHLLLQVHP